MRERFNSRNAGALAALVAVVLAVALITRGGDEGHRIHVVLPEATGVIVGQDVRVAGKHVGSIDDISAVDGGERVRIDLRIDDDAWPLPRGTRMILRTAGTVAYGSRYIAVLPPEGKASGTMRDGEQLPASQFEVPVEFDEFVGAFTADVRRDLRKMLRNGGANLRAAGPQLHRALEDGPAAAQELGGVFGDLAERHEALASLVRSASRVTAAVDRAEPDLRRMLEDAGTTLDALATDAEGVQRTLEAAPRTLVQARSTLKRADGTLESARVVTGRLAPGVTELLRTARPLNRVLASVTEVAPDARGALRNVRRATPEVNPLLATATELSPQLASIGRQAVEALNCIRPYTPEIVGFFPTWGDIMSAGDGRDKYLRATLQVFLPAPYNASAHTAGQLAKMVPSLDYGFPRPPGQIAGQPWFLPECGAGPDALDPDKDPEARSFNPLMQLPGLPSKRRKTK